MSIPADTGLVAGVDTHLDTHTAALCDARGRALARLQVPADPGGYAAVVAWARAAAAGSELRWAVDCTRPYGLGLARHLTSAGEQVEEIYAGKHAGKRRAGNSDAIDAVRAARELLARPNPAQTRADGDREALRLLMCDRDNAVASCKTARTLLTSLIVTAPADLRQQLRHLPRQQRATACAALAVPDGADRQTTVLYQTLARPGQRITASGTAPVPVASGRTDRHRLNRPRDRQLNRALHIVAVNRMRCHPPTQAYAQRRLAEGKTERDIRRCIKRYLARHFYRTLNKQLNPAPKAS